MVSTRNKNLKSAFSVPKIEVVRPSRYFPFFRYIVTICVFHYVNT